jgi:uncharacterized protein (TIGR02391 family)
MNEEQVLRMSFDPLTIEHLGVKMYSRLPSAVAELIANSYDADAKKVEVKLYNIGDERKIEISDDGVGMDFDEINEKFLRIGRNRRKAGSDRSPSGKRKVTGKKGLGKLALFGIGDVIEVKTIKQHSGKKTTFVMNWDNLISTRGGDYQPSHKDEECDIALHGTTIVLKKLRRKSPFNKKAFAVSLSKLFNFFDADFECWVNLDNDAAVKVTNELKYENIRGQFEWDFPEFLARVESEYGQKQEIRGRVISTEKPRKPGLRGITLFANGRLVNEPEFFGAAESSHVFSYLTGWLDVDFIDDKEEDVISTNRRSLNWDLPETAALRELLARSLRSIETDWSTKRKKKRKKQIRQQAQIDIEKWFQALPQDILPEVETIVDTIVDESELPSNVQSETVEKIHKLVPEYPYYHWRSLHKDVQDESKEAYMKKAYYSAFAETVKLYIIKVEKRSGQSTNSTPARAIMERAFGKRGKLSVTKNYKKPDGDDFHPQTKENIEEGQKLLSTGIVTGGRNLISHERTRDLRDSGLFSEKDCLDALSLLSHLFRRLDDSCQNLDE